MNRGKTALKRGVAVASVAAMAIAGAVLAAPAASAFPASQQSNMIRATPTVDAPFIVDPSAPNYGTNYSVTKTGAVPNLTVGKSYQAASGVQILLPTNAGMPAWSKGDAITVTLGQYDGAAVNTTNKVTFSGIPTGISVGNNAIDPTSLTTKAGHTGTNATAGTVISADSLKGAVVGAPSLSSDKTVLTVPLPDPTNAVGAAGAAAYLLSISNVPLTVASDVVLTNGLAVTATVGGTGTNPFPVGALTDGGTTTIAWLNPANLATSGSSTITGNTVTLPTLVLAEPEAHVLPNAAGDIRLTVSGTATTGNTLSVGLATGAAAVTNGSFTVTPSASGTEIKLTYTAGASPTLVESIAVSGVTVANVKPGTDLTISVNGPAGFSSAANFSTDTTGSTFSYTPDNVSGASVTVTPASTLPRIAGPNRYATAADVAAAGSWSKTSVVIANGTNVKDGVDALSANFLAGAMNAPILLTEANTLPTETQAALTSLFKGSAASITVYVMGKTDSVSQAVQDAIVKTIKDTATVLATVKVVAVAGNDRYETSADAASETGTSIASYDLGKGFLPTAFLASGQVNADALAAGAVSAGAHIPVLLTTNGDTLPKSVSDAITALHIGQVIILGSTDRVSQKVQDSLTAAGVNVVREAGTGTNGRYDTAALIATLAISAPTTGLGFTTGQTVYLANGAAGFPDALSVGPLAGLAKNVLLTVSDSATLPSTTSAFLTTNKATLSNVIGLGQSDRVADGAITSAQGLIG